MPRRVIKSVQVDFEHIEALLNGLISAGIITIRVLKGGEIKIDYHQPDPLWIEAEPF
ncbi:MAG: hypothetical protein GTO63_30105 [Anaerolineae bacterium]|nr:hypothetical protein [Anaerolineae bacterium]NIN98959.1 hypothetical protein [Anaerolineae bacterium]